MQALPYSTGGTVATFSTPARMQDMEEEIARLSEALTALEARLLDHEQHDRARIVVRWPRSAPVDGELLTTLRDAAFDRIIVEL